MRKQLIKFYDVFGVDVTDWNALQLMFGKNYLGLIILIIFIAIVTT